MCCAELYLAYHTLCDSWQLGIPINDLIPDRVMVFSGTKFYLEMDMGNMDFERLQAKVERYIKYAGSGEKVVFVLKDGQRKAEAVAKELTTYFQQRRLGNFCTLTRFENILKAPLGDVLYSPKDGRISITQLCSQRSLSSSVGFQ
jgi:Replication-relaxation